MAALPLVLAPGMLCDARLFGPQVAALGQEHICSVADLTRDETITGMAERLLAAAPAGRFALAGLSLGGIVAMEAARLAPERIASLALIATNHRAAGPAFIVTRQDQIRRARAGGLRGIVVDEMKGHYLGSARAGDRALLDLVLDMAMAAGPQVFARQARALIARRDQSRTLARFQGRLLLLCGADDALCPVATHRDMAALSPGAELDVIEGIGHLVSLEAPAQTTSALRRWLSD